MRARKICFFLFLIFLLLRLWGLQFGLPNDGLHPTENFSILQSIDYRLTGDLTPQNFQHPAFFQYLISGLSLFSPAQNIYYPYFYLLGRLISCIASLLAVFFLYRLAKELFNSEAFGLLTASFLGFNLLSVKYGHYAVPDSLSLLFIILSIKYALRIFRRSDCKDYLLCGLFCGLSIASKFSGLVSLVFLLSAYLFRENKAGGYPRLFLGLATAFLMFSLLSPYHIIFIKKAIVDFGEYFGEKGYFLPFPVKSSGFFIYPFIILPQVFGIFAFLFALVGLFIFFSKEERIGWFILAPSLLYLLIIGRETGGAVQNTLPFLPVLSICCGRFFLWLKEKHINGDFFALALCMGLLPQFFSSVIFDFFLLQKDTRVLAEGWLLKNAKQHSIMGFEPYTPYDLSYIRKSRVQGEFNCVYFTPSLSDYPAAYFKKEGFDYIVTSSFREDIYKFFCRIDNGCQEFNNYLSYDRQFTLVAEFKAPLLFKVAGISPPWGYWPHNPTIKIYRVR